MDFGSSEEEPVEAAVVEATSVDLKVAAEAEAARPPATAQGQMPATVPDDKASAAIARFEREEPVPSGWPIWLVAFGIAVLWALAPIAFAVGYRSKVSPLQDDAFAMAVFALLAIGPAFFVFGAAYLLRQGQKLAHETRRSKTMAEDMLAPSVMAAARAGDVTQSIRDEIIRAGKAAEEAHDTLLALREALSFETDKLTGATAQSVRTATELTGTLGRERTEMANLAQTLDTQATRVVDAIGQQARMVTEATGLAETQIREAETTLAARVADLAAAAGETSSAARIAGEDLTRHIARLETAGSGVADQIRAVETGLAEQRTALVTLSQVLRADQESFAQEADAHTVKLGEFIDQARGSATEIGQRAAEGGDILRLAMSEAAERFRELAASADLEREAFGQSTHQALAAATAAAADERVRFEAEARAAVEALARAAEDTRAAAAVHTAAAREQADHLSEVAFGAGQKANQVFEARLEEARALIEQSSKMVESAGEATARKLADGATAARATMEELTGMLIQLEERAATLPIAARGQADQVRSAVADGMEELMAQARRTAAEAQAIDNAFQSRVRRNFEMLSEAVRLMGVATVNQAADPASAAAPAAPQPAEPPAAFVLAPLPEPPAPDPDGATLADSLGLRNRIRFTPTATDREFSAVFEAAGGLQGAPPQATEAEDEDSGETWTWKDLLASLDSGDGEGERLENVLGGELARLGVEPDKLLPRARTDEIAAVMQAGDAEGWREVVRKLAPAATRRVGRRLFTDEDVKRRTEIYVRRYKTLIDDAIARDRSGEALQNLLGVESGRLFLLLDAAGGDMI
jgi:hypothetical protein